VTGKEAFHLTEVWLSGWTCWPAGDRSFPSGSPPGSSLKSCEKNSPHGVVKERALNHCPFDISLPAPRSGNSRERSGERATKAASCGSFIPNAGCSGRPCRAASAGRSVCSDKHCTQTPGSVACHPAWRRRSVR